MPTSRARFDATRHALYPDGPAATPPPHVVDLWLTIADDLHAPGHARRLVADSCVLLSESEHFDLALLVSELVTNAVTHGRPTVVLHLVCSDVLVRLDTKGHTIEILREGHVNGKMHMF